MAKVFIRDVVRNGHVVGTMNNNATLLRVSYRILCYDRSFHVVTKMKVNRLNKSHVVVHENTLSWITMTSIIIDLHIDQGGLVDQSSETRLLAGAEPPLESASP